MDGEKTKKRLTAPDVFIVAVLVLTVLALVGQSLAVYFIKRADSAQTLTVSFVARSVEATDVEALSAALLGAENGLEARIGDTTVGRLAGNVIGVPEVIDGRVSAHLVDMAGDLICAGKAGNGVCSIYGVGKVGIGQILPVYMNGGLWSIEITQIAEA